MQGWKKNFIRFFSLSVFFFFNKDAFTHAASRVRAPDLSNSSRSGRLWVRKYCCL